MKKIVDSFGLSVFRKLDKSIVQQQAGGSDDTKRDAKQLEKGDGENAEQTGTKTQQQGKIFQYDSALFLVGQLPSEKEKTAVFDGKKKDSPEDGEKTIEQRSDNRQHIEKKKNKHAQQEEPDFFQFGNKQGLAVGPEDGKGKGFDCRPAGERFLGFFRQNVIEG